MARPSSFRDHVIKVTKAIRAGRVLTYGAVARRAGHPRAARAVGMVMKKNRDETVPCHRVVRSDGSLGGYNGLRGEKERLLRAEGVRIQKGKIHFA